MREDRSGRRLSMVANIGLLGLVAISLAACRLFSSASAPPSPPRAERAAEETVDEGALESFRERGVDGAFVLLDVNRATRTIVNPVLARTGFLPASTFKIPNTLIGLQANVIDSERFALRWDGQTRSVAAWNRDHDLTTAMKYSVVWYYQEVARRIGAERMKAGVERFQYGNRDISGPIDEFWLSGNLRITPREQVEFLRRLRAEELPVTSDHAALLWRLITLEERDGIKLLGKTGLTVQDERAVGWLVGLVERNLDRYVFALLVLAPKERLDELIPMRRPLATALLSRYLALPRNWDVTERERN